MSSENALPPCERFTVLDSRGHVPLQCDVCDQREGAHEAEGRRVLSGGEIEELRRRMLIERYSMRAASEDAG